MTKASDRLIKAMQAAKENLARMTPEERATMWKEQRRSYAADELAMGSDKDEAATRAAVKGEVCTSHRSVYI